MQNATVVKNPSTFCNLTNAECIMSVKLLRSTKEGKADLSS